MSLTLHAPDDLSSKMIRDCLNQAEMPFSYIPLTEPAPYFSSPHTTQKYMICKPYKMGELIDTAIKILHKSYALPEEIKIKSAVFKPEKSIFEKDGLIIDLTEKECALLSELFKAAPEIVSKETLLENIWGYQTELETHTLETHIYRLRQKIETNPAAPALLQTDKDGYKLSLS